MWKRCPFRWNFLDVSPVEISPFFRLCYVIFEKVDKNQTQKVEVITGV